MKKRVILFLTIALFTFIIIAFISALVIWIGNKCFGWAFQETFNITILVEVIIEVITIGTKIIKFFYKKAKNAAPYVYKQEFNNEQVRLSFAYLIRIKVNNKYLLVKSGHKRNLFGPVGGVYHIEKTDYIFNKLGFYRDETPGDSADIRGRIKGKNITKFIKWFDLKKERETTPNREFYEELVNSGILDINLFGEPDFVFVGTKYDGISFSDPYHCYELKRFDIYELTIDDKQEKVLQSIRSNKSIFLATKEEIECLGITSANDKRMFGTQTPFILEDK